MALQFPPTDTLPAPTTGTLWTDPNGLVWRATVQDVSGTSVTSWTADMEANQLIICTQDTLGGNPRYTWAPVATPASPWIRDGGVIRPVNQGDDLEVKFNGVAGGDILIENYEELP